MIAYTSRTGNVLYIVNKLGLPNIEITETLKVNQPFLLCTYTDGLGSTPQLVEKFLVNNHSFCRGVIASGNTNFGQNFCKAAHNIESQYEIPIIRKLDLRGFQQDYNAIIQYYDHVMKEEGSNYARLLEIK